MLMDEHVWKLALEMSIKKGNINSLDKFNDSKINAIKTKVQHPFVKSIY